MVNIVFTTVIRAVKVKDESCIFILNFDFSCFVV